MDIITENIIISSLVISLLIQAFFFAFAYLFKTDKLTDLTYGLTFIILGAVALFASTGFSMMKLIVMLMVTLWALRLVSYLFYRIHKIKKDKRFDEMREDFLKFARFWILQGISVWIIMLPSSLMLSKSTDAGIGTISLLGLLIWAVGLITEAIADVQKFMFKNKPENKGKWIQSGLWAYSRHPNYFGEILCWVGVFIFITPALSGWEFLTIVSPVYIFILLRFVSGIPILEKKYAERYKDNKEYQQYKMETSLLFPLPKAS